MVHGHVAANPIAFFPLFPLHRPRRRHHRAAGRRGRPAAHRGHRRHRRLRGRAPRPPPRRGRGRTAGGAPVRRLPRRLRLQPRLLRGDRDHLRLPRTPRPPRPSVVVGGCARRRSPPPGRRWPSPSSSAAPGAPGAPWSGAAVPPRWWRPLLAPLGFVAYMAYPALHTGPARRLAAHRTGRMEELPLARVPVPHPGHVPARSPGSRPSPGRSSSSAPWPPWSGSC